MQSNVYSRSYFKDFLFLITLLSILLFYIALASYSPLDPAINSAHFPNVEPQNLIGLWGASISSIFIYMFGFTSYFFPIPFLMIGVQYSKKSLTTQKTFLYFISMIFFYFFISYFFSLFKPTINLSNIDISTLGVIGSFIIENFFLRLGLVGGVIVALFFGFFSTIFLFKYDSMREYGYKIAEYFKRK